MENLKNYNNLTNNTLSIGQRLIIGEKALNNLYTVQRGDTLYSIAKAFNVTIDELRNANNLGTNILTIGQTLVIPNISNIPANTQIYEVQKGDTLYNIANNFNTTVSRIKELNNLTSNILSIGQKLTLPY